MADDLRCQKHIWSGFHEGQCTRRATVTEPDGVLHCLQHSYAHSDMMKGRREKKYDRASKERELRYQVDVAERKVLEWVCAAHSEAVIVKRLTERKDALAAFKRNPEGV